ncbi:MAG: pyridoxal-phosphate dependent enzyme, partial [Rhodospirillales bacterium]|nr:pyridoxal-phosphate dependent enzyme [Rhodospirillales bacterium]
LGLDAAARARGVTAISAGNHAVAVAYAATRLGIGAKVVMLKTARPGIEVFGVEPEGADGMAQSFAAGGPLKLGALSGIADSLMAPHTEAYSYGLCRRHVDALVTVSDAALRTAMRLLFDELKLAVEPACAAATAAALGPLRARLAGRKVGLLLCGTNTDPATFCGHLAAA